jgi:hypothetical protein
MFFRNNIFGKKFLLIFLIGFHVFQLKAQVLINEIMASNSTTISDEDDDYSDWIELFNAGNQSVNLNGYGLSDSYSNPYKWVLPDVDIPAKGFLLIWASGKDRRETEGQLHTNYAISASGEEVLLTDPTGNRLDEIPPIAIPTDISYGRSPDGSDNLVFFEKPTPGLSNEESSFSTLLIKPFISIKEIDGNKVTIEITNPNNNGVILYSLDGSEPSIEGLEGIDQFEVDYYFEEIDSENRIEVLRNTSFTYKDPVKVILDVKALNFISDIITTYNNEFGIIWKKPEVTIPKGSIVRARVFQEGSYSKIASKTIFPEEVFEKHSLPILSVITDNKNLFGYEEGIYVPGKRFFEGGGSIHNFVSSGNYQRSGRENEKEVYVELFKNRESVFSQGLGMRIHGGGSRTRPVKGFRLYARNDYDDANIIDYPLIPSAVDRFGNSLSIYRRILFRNGGDRLDYLSDAVIHQVLQPMKVGIQSVEPMVHYINGEYWGLTNARDRIDRFYVGFNYDVDPDQVILIEAPWGDGSPEMVEEGDPSDIEFYRELRNIIIDTDLTTENSLDIINEKLDILSFIDHVIAFVYWNNVDWYGDKHFRIWKSRNQSSHPYEDGRFRYIVWDFDASLTNGAGFNTLINWIHPDGEGNEFATGDPEKTRFLRKLLSNEAFKNLFINRFNDMINSSFKPERIIQIAESHFEKISTEFDLHFDRWGFYPSSVDFQYAYKNYLTRFSSYSNARPASQREHLRESFDLNEDIQISVDINESGAGFVKLNTIELNKDLPSVEENVYPWDGVYFKDIPISLIAVPESGFVFDFWQIGEEVFTDIELELIPEMDIEVIAHFKKDSTESREVLYYWLFDGSLPNNTPLLNLEPFYQSNEEMAGLMSFEPAISPYPLSEDNTDGIMDRVNDPTPINFLGERLSIVAYSDADIRGIRTRNPLEIADGEEIQKGYLVFEMPTPLFKGLVFKAAVSRTNNGPEALIFEYSLGEETEWTNAGIEQSTYEMSTDFGLLEIDLSEITEINNNENFKLRIGFTGNTTINSGNVRFNNLSLEGLPFDDSDLITNIPNTPKEDIKLIKALFPNPSKEIAVIELNENAFEEISSIQVLDMQGRIVEEIQQPQSARILLNTGTWGPGTYIIKVVSMENLEIRRLIKN